jgi:hypothetical protein
VPSPPFKTATLLDGLRVIELNGKAHTKFKHWCGTNPRFIEHIRAWGEVEIVKLKDLGTWKVADQGTQCMMVGYSADHTSNCYKMWNSATGGIPTTHNIIWLKRMNFPKITVTPPADGNDIQVTITVQHSSIEAGEGVPLVDSEATEVRPFTK